MRWGRGPHIVAALLMGAALHAHAWAAQKPIADVKFDSPGHQVVVQVTLGKQGPFAMLLDTGTPLSVIDASLGRRLRALSDAGLPEGAGGEPAWDMVDLKLGHLRADTVEAQALDLGRISDRLRTHIDGVLGYNFLRERVVQIDYLRHRVRFYHDTPSWSGSESEEFQLMLGRGDPAPRFSGRVNRRDVLLRIDTGAPHRFAVTGRSIDFLGLRAAFDAAAPDSAGADSASDRMRLGRVPVIEIGQIRFTDQPCFFGVPGYGETWDPKLPAGTIGGALLEGMVVTLDYPHRRIRFER